MEEIGQDGLECVEGPRGDGEDEKRWRMRKVQDGVNWRTVDRETGEM